ncbi:MAG: carboxylesterase family protein [Erysipelotrichaceae bacterium]|nr:carboxylesterase family protein [Erysipelotrichaceae bacterium]
MKNVLTVILRILLIVLFAAVLELNHNTFLGWILFLFLTGAWLWLILKKGHGFLFSLAYILCFVLILFLTWPPVRNVPAVSVSDPKRTQTVTVKDGQLRGVFNKDETVEVYAGIPYAKPPVGNLRWKEPQDPEPWEGVLEADHFAPMSMQEQNIPLYDSLVQIIGYHDYRISLHDNYRPPVSEDSLYLNIWKPAGEQKDLPVLVFIHGGSLQTGLPWHSDYNGEGLAEKGIIVVNLAYRLGIFGFYADEDLARESKNRTTGNYGLLDMIKGLQWIKENIASFGGDPEQITLAGESAGSAAVSALCTSPLAEGLFRYVILESSTLASVEPPHSYRTLDEALASGKELKDRYQADSLAELRSLSAEELVKEAQTQHHITVDGYVLMEVPYLSYRKGIHNESAILHGYNSKESRPFILFSQGNMKNYEERIRRFFKEYADPILAIYPAENDEEAKEYWAEIYGAIYFNYPHYCLDRLAVLNEIPVYEYYFSKENGRLGPWHSGEEVYVYHDLPEFSPLYQESDYQLSDIAASYWINFVSNGNPNGGDLPEWPQNLDGKTLLELGDEVKVISERSLKLYEVLDEMYGWMK